ncbi:MAG: hypothetical protein DRP15_00715 [Candidatus Aenigmatarchaeota archaeon]|nr:MAG: hypothetical protein DRP15_00715 [Candidatus Aenigmarchaeota archaeon]
MHETLKRLVKTGRIKECAITIVHNGSVTKRGTIYGRDIVGVDRKSIRYLGGEAIYEEISVPLDNILEIRTKDRIIWKKKKRIKRKQMKK